MAETINNFKIQFIGLNWDKRRELMKEIETTDLEIGRYYEHFSESDKGDFIYGDPCVVSNFGSQMGESL